jgi:integrase
MEVNMMVSQVTMEDLKNSTQLAEELKEPYKGYWFGFKSTLKPSTAKVYQSDVIDFILTIQNKNINNVIAKDWTFYQETCIAKGISNYEINQRLAAVRSFFNYLVKTGIKSSNPFSSDKVKMLETDEKKRTPMMLTWEQINAFKSIQDDKLKEIFKWAYYENKKIKDTGRDGSYIDYNVKAMGNQVGIEGLKYSDLTAARKRYFATCPITGQELEMTEENWMFKDGLLQARGEHDVREED